MKDFINGDCMDGMKDTPDNFYDLAIVDPPYGIGEDGGKSESRCNATKVKPSYFVKKGWDNNTPTTEYFKELQRVSRHQIIWGGNYFLDYLSATSCFIVWDKDNGTNDFADCELAWCSFKTAVRKFRYRWHGMIQEDMKNKEQRYHPTQKPIQLYKWLLRNYAQTHFKLLSTHVGSASDLIAFEDFGCEYRGYEIDKDYYEAASKRLANHKSQLRIF